MEVVIDGTRFSPVTERASNIGIAVTTHNVAIRWNGRLFKNTGDLGFRVGVQYGAKLSKHPDKAANSPTPHWRLLELGTEKMKAQPFLRPAADASIDAVVNAFISGYGPALDRAIARAKKKGSSS